VLSRYAIYGVEGLLEGHRSGRPRNLSEPQREQLVDIIDSGPVAYGLNSGIWISPMLARVIEEELGVHYHPGHVCRLLHQLGFSVQRPRCRLARADLQEQDRWHRYIYPNLKKNAKRKLGANFYRRSQFPTGLHPACHLEPSRTGPRGLGTGERKSVKILGAIELWRTRFHYRQ